MISIFRYRHGYITHAPWKIITARKQKIRTYTTNVIFINNENLILFLVDNMRSSWRWMLKMPVFWDKTPCSLVPKQRNNPEDRILNPASTLIDGVLRFQLMHCPEVTMHTSTSEASSIKRRAYSGLPWTAVYCPQSAHWLVYISMFLSPSCIL
jgi:hypothetical protein